MTDSYNPYGKRPGGGISLPAGPLRVFGVTEALPDRAALAAERASVGSDFPTFQRSWRFGRSTSTTTIS
jgi:hypothetical protein